MGATQLPGAEVVRAPTIDLALAREALDSVTDPEIPVLTISDLGILRGVTVEGDTLVVTITPTYSGCPAMDRISDDVAAALSRRGFDDVEVRLTHSPAWSTDWITEEGRRKLDEHGIAPPGPEGEVVCPRCRAPSPRMTARFGSTACKALMTCSSCGEPFHYFKELR